MKEQINKVKTQGRTSLIDGILMTDFSGSGIEFNFNGSGDIIVVFSASQLTEGDEGGCYFSVFVDGEKMPRDFCHITAQGDTYFKVVYGLADGEHNIKIHRQTESERATVGIKKIIANGEITAPEKSDLYIEFVGDSITTAYGNLALNSQSVSSPSMPLYQDVTQGYAYLTAMALGADYSIVARQGIGASVGYQPISMPTVYPLLRHPKDVNTPYSFTTQPDIVVIGLGTNDSLTYNNPDIAKPVKTKEDVKQGFKDMISLVRTKNPNAKIVWIYGMMLNGVNDLVIQAVSEMGGSEKGIYSKRLTANTQGGNGHPYYTGHSVMATELTDFLRSLIN